MAVVRLAPLLVARRVQTRAVGHHHVVAAVGGGIPDRLVLAHQDGGDARGEATERRGSDSLGRSLDGREGGVRGDGRDVVPDTGVG